MRNYILFICSLFFIGCASVKNKKATAIIEKYSENEYFTGFSLYNPVTKKILLEHNAHKYFTPASTAKIFTLYTALLTLKDSIPAIEYQQKNDTLFIKATGDPTLLHPYFNNLKVINFIKTSSAKNIIINTSFFDNIYGPGWAWEDYEYYFMPQRSALPIHGNVITSFLKDDSLKIIPDYFKDNFTITDIPLPAREFHKNIFYKHPSIKDTMHTPFIVNDTILKTILQKHTHKKITFNQFNINHLKTLYSIAADSLYREMMIESDNFLAEQILVLTSGIINDSLSVNKTLAYAQKNYLSFLKEPPKWVDGSGLSRYNLFTPNSFVQVLNTLYQTIPEARLLQFFPIGGTSGTLKNHFYIKDKLPYVYAKSGTLSNNYCLSGYIKTKSGKTLIFSYMANHFKMPLSTIKNNLQQLLEVIYFNY